MSKFVNIKNTTNNIYVKMAIMYEFDIPFGLWIGIEDNKIYSSDELIFLN